VLLGGYRLMWHCLVGQPLHQCQKQTSGNTAATAAAAAARDRCRSRDFAHAVTVTPTPISLCTEHRPTAPPPSRLPSHKPKVPAETEQPKNLFRLRRHPNCFLSHRPFAAYHRQQRVVPRATLSTGTAQTGRLRRRCWRWLVSLISSFAVH